MDIDYYRVNYPDEDELPKEQWNTEERRAYILELILEKGHPKLINQTELGKEFGISQASISKDLDVLADNVKEHMGKKVDLLFDSLYRGCIKELKEEGNYKELRKWVKDWKEFLMERGKVSKTAEKVQVERRPIEFNLVEEVDEISLEADK